MGESLRQVHDPAPETDNTVLSLKRIRAQVAEVSSHRPQRIREVSQQEPVAGISDSQTGRSDRMGGWGGQDVWCQHPL